MGDAPDAGRLFDYPEFSRLDKTRPDDDRQEASNAVLRVDAAAVNLGKNVSFVQSGFDASGWRSLNLPHDYKNGGVAATTVVETTGAPAKLVLTTDRNEINDDGEDVAVINVSTIDAQGRAVPTASNRVKFAITGGKIIGVGNGDPAGHESDRGVERSLFNGLAQVIVQRENPRGTIQTRNPGVIQ